MVTYCKKITFGNLEDPKIILGIIAEEDTFFMTIKTAKRTYQLNKSQIISIEETKQPFRTFSEHYKNDGVWS